MQGQWGTSFLKFLIYFSKGTQSPGKSWCFACLFTSNLFLPEMEFAKGLQKMANSCKQTISQEVSPHVPKTTQHPGCWAVLGESSPRELVLHDLVSEPRRMSVQFSKALFFGKIHVSKPTQRIMLRPCKISSIGS